MSTFLARPSLDQWVNTVLILLGWAAIIGGIGTLWTSRWTGARGSCLDIVPALRLVVCDPNACFDILSLTSILPFGLLWLAASRFRHKRRWFSIAAFVCALLGQMAPH